MKLIQRIKVNKVNKIVEIESQKLLSNPPRPQER